MSSPPRNSPCSCGSGRKWKRCHGFVQPPSGDGRDPSASSAMAPLKRWTTFSQLLGEKIPVSDILQMIGGYNRADALFTLSKIAADMANKEGGISGPDAYAWSVDLLIRGANRNDPREAAIAEGVAALGKDAAIVHGRVIFTLQALLMRYGQLDGGRRPPDGQIALLMLALNDHIPEWEEQSPDLSDAERCLAMMAAESIFNQTSDDPLRFVVRSVDILEGDVAGTPLTAEKWREIQEEAFGCSFGEYVERFLLPMYLLSKTWGAEKALGINPALWSRNAMADHYRRWFDEASAPIEADSWVQESLLASGIPVWAPSFYRTPFVRRDGVLLPLSPWHVKDYVNYGAWGKLNGASKRVLKTQSNQQFASTFGYLFERWCARVASEASEASEQQRFKGRLLLPVPGIEDVEDVVVIDGDTVVLFSAKASLIPEASLKVARDLGAIVAWHRRFFFEEVAEAKKKGQRGGALYLINAAVKRIRSGKYEDRGVPRNARIIPVVVAYDHIVDGLGLYRWIEEECAARGILGARDGVRPVTVVGPETFEVLFAAGRGGYGIADLLIGKTEPSERLGPAPWFLAKRLPMGLNIRLPTAERRFWDLSERAQKRLQEIFETSAAA
jgi:hypothetical protein